MPPIIVPGACPAAVTEEPMISDSRPLDTMSSTVFTSMRGVPFTFPTSMFWFALRFHNAFSEIRNVHRSVPELATIYILCMNTEWTPSACQLLQILRCDDDLDLPKRKDTVDMEELVVWG